MNKKLIWAAVVAILAGGIFTLRLSGRDERIIRKTFRQAVSSMEKDGAESPVTAALRADSIA
ncbi:MAG: hypothetical protein U1E27_03110, partial [Kiritimatiellia bacterium]|nr:hypothetical protein [Kiritimatiellia bacterium]